MSTNPIAGDVTLDSNQIQLVRGAINAGIEYAALANDPILTTFDSTRLPHLESASDLLGTALDQTAPGGTFRGRMTPSEIRATRMAVGFVEAELTPPVSPALDGLPINPTADELSRLGDALDGLTPASDEDVAYSDWRMGVNTDAIVVAIPDFQAVLQEVRSAASADRQAVSPMTDAREAAAVVSDADGDCAPIAGAMVDAATAAAALTSTRRDEARQVLGELSDVVEAVLATDCFYENIDRAHLETAFERVREAENTGDNVDITLAAMDLVTAWAWNMARRKAASL